VASIIIVILKPTIGAISIGVITFLILVCRFYHDCVDKDGDEDAEDVENAENINSIKYKCDFTLLKKKLTTPLDEECIICLSIISEDCIELECGHIYHDECIKRWFEIKSSCTICRV
jgi:hypothetical protein